MANYIFVSDVVPKLAPDSQSARLLWGLARGLLAQKHTVTVVTIATGDVAGRIPGLARRLRKVAASVGSEDLELGFFEGSFSAADPQLIVLDGPCATDSDKSVWLAAGCKTLAREGLLKADAVVAWGETAALALEAIESPALFFALPAGLQGIKLTRSHKDALDRDTDALAVLGVNASQMVLCPSTALADALEAAPEMDERPADEPIVPLLFGCDDEGPETAKDTNLAAPFSALELEGKGICRRSLLKSLSLVAEPSTTVAFVPEIPAGSSGQALCHAIASGAKKGAVFVIPQEGVNPRHNDLLAVMAIEHPTQISLVTDAKTLAHNAGYAASDVVLLHGDPDNTGRLAGRAMRYGALPLAPHRGAFIDFLVDVDLLSLSGNAFVYAVDEDDAATLAVGRAMAAKANPSWGTLVANTIRATPTWAKTGAIVEELRVAVTPAEIKTA